MRGQTSRSFPWTLCISRHVSGGLKLCGVRNRGQLQKELPYYLVDDILVVPY